MASIILRVEPAQGAPWECPFSGDAMTIGRAHSADLPIPDRFLSRHHARIFRDGDRLLVEDLGSRNGTRVNDVLVQGAHPVGPGDVIQLSSSRISVEDAAAPASDRDGGPSGVSLYQSASRLLEETSHVRLAEIASQEELRRFADRLRLLNDVHQALGRSLDPDELLELILERAFEHLGPEEGAIYLLDENGEPRRAAARAVAGGAKDPTFSRSLVHEVIEKGVAALVLDVEHDERFNMAVSLLNAGVRSVVAAPLLDAKEALGMIVLSSRAAKRHFGEDDLQLLVSLASVAALRLRNVRLAAEAAERRVLEKEVALARRIQTALLSSVLPEVSGWELHAGTIPSRTVSGDLYQVLKRGEEIVVVVADVAGKGIAASLLTASFEALAASPIADGLPPDEVCSRVGAHLHRRTPPEKYATAFLAVLDPATGRLCWTNAGHNAALVVRRDGTVETLEATGIPLGLLPGATYTCRESVLERGDLLLVYTDGVTEAADAEGVEYGLPRLKERCGGWCDKAVLAFVEALEDDVARFAAAPPFQDDVTIVALRRLPEPA